MNDQEALDAAEICQQIHPNWATMNLGDKADAIDAAHNTVELMSRNMVSGVIDRLFDQMKTNWLGREAERQVADLAQFVPSDTSDENPLAEGRADLTHDHPDPPDTEVCRKLLKTTYLESGDPVLHLGCGHTKDGRNFEHDRNFYDVGSLHTCHHCTSRQRIWP